jgi:NADPH-dependent glutamate synthase beta subunit-like oxidoreductase
MRLSLNSQTGAELVLNELSGVVLRRISSGSSMLCPVDMAAAFLRLCHAQSCGKCVPCRIGLGQLTNIMESILAGTATMADLELMRKTARAIYNSADCAIGYEAANIVLRGLDGFKDDYVGHIVNGRCTLGCEQGVPCMSLCPAGVEIPGYIALVGEGRYADAIRLIRKDNPFPTVCGYVCEHPCEARCRRRVMDDAINIRGIKRFAADNAGEVDPPKNAPPTGKTVAVIGGGPAGLTAAYYLSLMGHKVTLFEKRKRLGGMLWYGIPRYRLPADKLNTDIEAILKTGIEVVLNTEIGGTVKLRELRRDFDAVYISIGAHIDKKLTIDGSDGLDVIPAIEMLRNLGDGDEVDLTGRTVAVIGGGNVAMDAARSAVRLGAKKVNIVYRRRKQDMPALPEEVEGALAEGCELITLSAPDSIERNDEGLITGLWLRPQISGKIDSSGRPEPLDAREPKTRLSCDLIIVAIGQNVESEHFRFSGIQLNRDVIDAKMTTEVPGHKGLFAGGDCVTGPATVIRAIAAGKVAAANIDEYLGFNHIISPEVDIPPAKINNVPAWGRANMTERLAEERRRDFEMIEQPYNLSMAEKECSRCLRCDHYGFGPYWEDRRRKW